VTARSHVELDAADLRGVARKQVVRARSLDPRQRGRALGDRAVVEQPQVAEAVLGEQRIGLGRVDLAAQQVRDLAVAQERVVVLEPPGIRLQQQCRRAGVLDLLAHVAPVLGLVGAGQPVDLAVEDDAGAGLEHVAADPERAGVAQQRCPLAAGVDDELDARSRARLERPRAEQREVPVRIVQEGRAAAQERAVEIAVDAPERSHRAT
jgi:hypothetical protein